MTRGIHIIGILSELVVANAQNHGKQFWPFECPNVSSLLWKRNAKKITYMPTLFDFQNEVRLEGLTVVGTTVNYPNFFRFVQNGVRPSKMHWIFPKPKLPVWTMSNHSEMTIKYQKATNALQTSLNYWAVFDAIGTKLHYPYITVTFVLTLNYSFFPLLSKRKMDWGSLRHSILLRLTLQYHA